MKMSKKKDPKTIEVEVSDKDDKEKKVAEVFTNPNVLAASTIKGRYTNLEVVNVNKLIPELEMQAREVKSGNMDRMEGMLVAQAHSLDCLFHELAARSRLNMNEYLDATHKFMNLALRAQGQCRSTIETLSEMKNPKPFIQHNKAQYQQVNNGNEPSRARESENISNELLEDKTHEQEWLDTGTPETTSGDDKELETVGAQHGRKD